MSQSSFGSRIEQVQQKSMFLSLKPRKGIIAGANESKVAIVALTSKMT